jgi:hypothetical protein
MAPPHARVNRGANTQTQPPLSLQSLALPVVWALSLPAPSPLREFGAFCFDVREHLLE